MASTSATFCRACRSSATVPPGTSAGPPAPSVAIPTCPEVITQSPTRRTGEYGPTTGLMCAPLLAPMVPRRRGGARTAARRVGHGRCPLRGPGRGKGGDEHGVGAVDRPLLFLVQADLTCGMSLAARSRRSGRSGRRVGPCRPARCPRSRPAEAWCTAPSAYERTSRGQHLARPQLDLDPAALPRRRPDPTRARPAPGAATSPHPCPAGPPGRARTACTARTSAQTAPRRSVATAGPSTSTSSTSRRGQSAATRAARRQIGRPGLRPRRTTPVPSRRRAIAPLEGARAVTHDVFATPEHADRRSPSSSANARARPGTGLWCSPPKAPPAPAASGEAEAPPGRLSWRRARHTPAPPRWSAG